jgi:hypothetical protein
MTRKPGLPTKQLRHKLYYVSLGLTAGAGAQVLGQGCITSGQ